MRTPRSQLNKQAPPPVRKAPSPRFSVRGHSKKFPRNHAQVVFTMDAENAKAARAAFSTEFPGYTIVKVESW